MANIKLLLIGRTWPPQSHHRNSYVDFIKGLEIRQPVCSASLRCREYSVMKETEAVCGQARVLGPVWGDKSRSLRDCLLVGDNGGASAVN